MKITTEDDLVGGAGGVSRRPARVGTGYDLHRLVDGRPLMSAASGFQSTRGPAAHSDGDVACHAAIDAMLGAAGLGDIGRHFPDTEPEWRGASGLDLLRRAAELIGHGITSRS